MGSTSAKKKARIGYDYVHSVVDDHSRYAYSEILADETAETTAAFFPSRHRSPRPASPPSPRS